MLVLIQEISNKLGISHIKMTKTFWKLFIKYHSTISITKYSRIIRIICPWHWTFSNSGPWLKHYCIGKCHFWQSWLDTVIHWNIFDSLFLLYQHFLTLKSTYWHSDVHIFELWIQYLDPWIIVLTHVLSVLCISTTELCILYIDHITHHWETKRSTEH